MEDHFADPEGERGAQQRVVHLEVLGEVFEAAGHWFSALRRALEGPYDSSLVGVDHLRDSAVLEFDVNSRVAESVQPSELARVLEGLEARLVALLEVGDGVGDFVGFVLELGPEEAGKDFGVEGGLEEAFGAHVVLGGAEGVQACGGDFFGAGVEFLGAADGAVEAAGVLDVFDHYFAALEAGFAEADF